MHRLNLRSPARVLTPMRLVGLCLLLVSSGCATEVNEHIVELEATTLRLESRIDALVGLERRIKTLEALAARPSKGEDEALRQQLVLLEAEVTRLRERLTAVEAGARPPARTDKPIRPTKPGPRVLTIPTPEVAARAPAPLPNTEVEVLTVGGGGLVLVRVNKRLERVRLLGVEPPARLERYRRDPTLRSRHARLFRDVSGKAYQDSRDHLSALVKKARITIVYSTGKKRDPSGSLRAYLQRVRGKVVEDLNSRMISDGFAIPSADDHLRADEYKALGAKAQASGSGLVKPTE